MWEDLNDVLLVDGDGFAHFDHQLLYDIKKLKNFSALRILQNESDAEYMTDSEKQTLLHHAAEAGNPVITKYLINLGADVNAQDYCKRTPIMCIWPNFNGLPGEVLKILLQAKANIHVCDCVGTSALSQSLTDAMYHEPFLKKLHEEYSGDIQQIAKILVDLKCSLYCAVSLRNTEVTRLLIEHRCPLEPPENPISREKILVTSAYFNDLHAAKYLLDLGVDVNTEDSKGSTSLCSMYEELDGHKNLELLQLMLDRGAKPTKILEKHVQHRGKMQMFKLLESGKAESIQLLLEKSNADLLEAKDKHGRTALHYMAKNPWPNVFRSVFGALKGRKFDLNVRDNDGRTPLHHVTATNLSTVKFLVDRGADVNAEDNSGMTLLAILWQDFRWRIWWNNCVIKERIELDKSKKVVAWLIHHGADFLACHSNEPLFIFSRVRNTRQFTWIEYMLAQLRILEARGLFIEDSIRNEISKHNKSRRFFDLCKRQLDRMKRFEVWKSITLYELLTADDTKIERYVRSKKLLLNLRRMVNANQSKRRYCRIAYYLYVLRDRVVQAIQRVKRRKDVAAILCETVDLDDLVADKVAKYLGDCDLQKMYCTHKFE